MAFVPPHRSGELVVRRAQLSALRPFPAWNGSVSSPPPSSASPPLCSVLSDSGSLVVVEIDECAPEGGVSGSAFAQVRKVLTPRAAAPVDNVSQCWTSDGRFLVAAFGAAVAVYDAHADFEQVAALQLRHSAASIATVQPRCGEDKGKLHRQLLIVGSGFGAELYQLHPLPSPGAVNKQPLEIATPVATVYRDVAIGLVQTSADGRFAALGSVDGRVFVRNLTSLDLDDAGSLTGFGAEALSKLLPSPRVTGLAFSVSGNTLLAATRKGNVFVFAYEEAASLWRWSKAARHLGENPKSGGAGGSTSAGNAAAAAAAATQTMVEWWTPSIFAVCSRSAPSRIELFDVHSGKTLHSLSFSATKRRQESGSRAAASRTGEAALSEWVEEPQVTGLCVLPRSRRLLLHDTSRNLLEVDWPVLRLLSGQPPQTTTEEER